MASIRVAIDNIQGKSADKKTLNTFAEKLRAAGHTVTTHGVGPNQIQHIMQEKSNKCDVMIQIAGGKCLGTLVDFYMGLNKYYYASAGGFAYFKCWDANWKAHRAGDDGFSKESNIAPYKGKTLPEIYSIMNQNKKLAYGYGTTAEECAKTWLSNYGGGNGEATTDTKSGGGSSLLDIIKQICTDWNKYGVEATLTGDTVNIKRTNPNTAKPLTERQIVNNSVSFTDYDNSTPNTYGKVKDHYLYDRFGQIPLDEEEVQSVWEDQVLQMSQRNHGHSIDLKCILNPDFVEGKWVKLTLPRYNIENRPYYISKLGYSEERTMSLTLEPGPPELYQELQEVVEESTTEEESTT